MIKLKGQISVVQLYGKIGGDGAAQSKVVAPSEQPQTIKPDVGYTFLHSVEIEGAPLQEKETYPHSEEVIVYPDEGYYGMSAVRVRGVPDGGRLETVTVAPSVLPVTVQPSDGYYGMYKVIVEAVPLQEKTVTPTTEEQTITPDAGNLGLSAVTVEPAPLQEKIVTPTAEEQNVVPDDGSVGLSNVLVEAAPLEELYVMPTDSVQTFTPDAPYIGFFSVIVAAAEGGGTGGDGGGEDDGGVIEPEITLPSAEETTFGADTSRTAFGDFILPALPLWDTSEYPYQAIAFQYYLDYNGTEDNPRPGKDENGMLYRRGKYTFHFVAASKYIEISLKQDAIGPHFLWRFWEAEAPNHNELYTEGRLSELYPVKVARYELGPVYTDWAPYDPKATEYAKDKYISPPVFETETWREAYREQIDTYEEALRHCDGCNVYNGDFLVDMIKHSTKHYFGTDDPHFYEELGTSITGKYAPYGLVWCNFTLETKTYDSGTIYSIEPHELRQAEKVYLQREEEYRVQGDTMNELLSGAQDLAGSNEPMTPDEAADFLNNYEAPEIQIEETITPSLSEQTVLPDEGYDGIAKVIVEATPMEELTVTPTAEMQEFLPNDEYLGFSKVVVEAAPVVEPPVLEEITITPSEEEQIVYPNEGYDYISKVTVLAAPSGGSSVPNAMGVGF